MISPMNKKFLEVARNTFNYASNLIELADLMKRVVKQDKGKKWKDVKNLCLSKLIDQKIYIIRRVINKDNKCEPVMAKWSETYGWQKVWGDLDSVTIASATIEIRD